jgi:hypothetical protein
VIGPVLWLRMQMNHDLWRLKREMREELARIPTYRAVRTERFKYVEHSTGDRELSDLRRDPDGSFHGLRGW